MHLGLGIKSQLFSGAIGRRIADIPGWGLN
jgi:hypothetical protein